MTLTKKQQSWLAVAIVLVILVIDQIIKIHVKTTMYLGESIEVTPWFQIDFIENNGMAWGMTFFNKLILSLFRIVAISVIGWYIGREIRRGTRTRYVVFLSMVLAGAAGNIFDSMFYGLVFSASQPFSTPAYWVPFGQGYSSFLLGKVVDMFRFPFFTIVWPEWMPLVGGDRFTFFDPVFNFADASITSGVIALLLFCRKDLGTLSGKSPSETKKEEA